MLNERVAIFCLAAATMFASGTVHGQQYPNKPLRIMSGTVGGNGDFNARLIAQGLTAALGQSVIVDNRGTLTAAETVKRAAPDGYTLLVLGASFWIGPLLQSVPYDPVRDFAPIAATTSSPSVLVVHPSLPVKSVKDLIALCKTRPGQFNYAAATPGSPANLAGELFKAMAGLDIVAIHYKGAGPALNDLLGNQVQLMFASAAASAPHIKAGRLNALAVGSSRPSALFPGLATVADSGLAGYESDSRQGIWAPARTPATLVKRLNHEVVEVLNKADVKQKFLGVGAETVGTSPEEFALIIRSEMARLGKVIKDVGIKGTIE